MFKDYFIQRAGGGMFFTQQVIAGGPINLKLDYSMNL